MQGIPRSDDMVLVVEPNRTTARILGAALAAEAYQVRLAHNGRDAMRVASEAEPDVVILDLDVPDIDGLEVCRQLRIWLRHPIVVLSADSTESRKIAALDDYLTMPLSIPELLARVRVAMRHRHATSSIVDPPVLTVGDMVIDTGAHEVQVDGRRLGLTRKEFSLVTLLARNAGRVLTHEVLLTYVWGSSRRGGTQSLRVHVAQLRKKLGEGPLRPRLTTEPGVGYALIPSDPL